MAVRTSALVKRPVLLRRRPPCGGQPRLHLVSAGEHFVDDETSRTLFLGYACCASELAAQLEQEGVRVDAASPLVVHVPCGVGGAPSGILYGLKLVFGDHVHVFFAEPCNAPCVTLSLASRLNERVAVADIGLSCKTEADGARSGTRPPPAARPSPSHMALAARYSAGQPPTGCSRRVALNPTLIAGLAVGRASPLCCAVSAPLVAGCYTVADHELFEALGRLVALEGEGAFMVSERRRRASRCVPHAVSSRPDGSDLF